MKKIIYIILLFFPTFTLAYIVFTPKVLSFVGKVSGGIAILFWIYLIFQTTLLTIYGLKWCKKQIHFIKCHQYSESIKNVLIGM